LFDHFGLATLPDAALDVAVMGRLPYVATPALRAAARSAWEGRQLRITLLGLAGFMLMYWLTATRPMNRPFGDSRNKVWLFLAGGLLTIPMFLAGQNPGWLTFPLLPLL